MATSSVSTHPDASALPEAGNEGTIGRLSAGVEAFRTLCRRIDTIGNESAGESGEDGRDYAAMSTVCETVLHAVANGDAATREGFARAMVDILSTICDGMVPVDPRGDEWQPLASTAGAFERAQGAQSRELRA